MKKKTLALLLACCLIVGVTAGGTLAWLTDKADPVTNAFTTTDIDVTLIETKKPDGTEVTAGVTDWSAQMIPGWTYSKNPTVTVKADSVDCYLFVEFEVTNPSDYLFYTSTLTAANDWTVGKGDKSDENPSGDGIPTNVWYREVISSDNDQSWELLEGKHVDDCEKDATCSCPYAHGYVYVKDTLTKENMPESNTTLTYTAYASQLYQSSGVKFSAEEAWKNVPKSTT